ncbi:hypothetical protein QL285_051674 [Trifolium repens]|jgi:hypothetical protein|nr:hypothetical protein QL285_051674 [Trifolium repens]
MCKHKKQTQNADNDSFFHIANHRFTPFFQKKKTKTSLVLTANRTLAHRKSNQYFSLTTNSILASLLANAAQKLYFLAVVLSLRIGRSITAFH